MFATFSLADARSQLNDSIRLRLSIERERERAAGSESMHWPFPEIRFPVGLFFVRGDRAEPGQSLAKQVIASFGYWNADSGYDFDMVFPGWGKRGEEIVFDQEAFLQIRDEIEATSKWKYSGETDALLLHYDYTLATGVGDFAFDETMFLPVEAMVRDGRVSSLDALMHEIIRHAKETWPRTDRSIIWEMSDRIAVDRGRQSLWDFIKKRFLADLAGIYNELRPFAVCDLRRSTRSD